jgi:hypothetical protein
VRLGWYEVLARCVGIRCVHLVARYDIKVSELYLDLVGDSHDGNRWWDECCGWMVKLGKSVVEVEAEVQLIYSPRDR